MKFQKGFYLGAATAAHQVEGNNTNSDYWVMENLPGSAFTDPSGIACDHYRRYKEEFSRYLPVIKDDDFIGVQNYTRSIVGPDGEQPVSDGAEVTQMGYEYYPKSVAWQRTTMGKSSSRRTDWRRMMIPEGWSSSNAP